MRVLALIVYTIQMTHRSQVIDVKMDEEQMFFKVAKKRSQGANRRIQPEIIQNKKKY